MKPSLNAFLSVAATLAIVLSATDAALAEINFTKRVMKVLHLPVSQPTAATPPEERTVLKPPSITGAPTIEYDSPTTPPIPQPVPAPAQVPQGTTVLRPIAPPVVVYRPAPIYQPRWVYRPVVPLARPPKTYVVGRGVLGQPKVYVPAQPVRNILRWISP
jgi:hypothetical protein